MKITRLTLLFVFFTSLLSAQTKQLSLEDIWNGTFSTKRLDALHSMNNGKQYAVLNRDAQTANTTIDIYDYKTLEKTKTLVNSANLEAIKNFGNYKFSQDESKVILATEEKSIFRRSKQGIYYVLEIDSGKLTKISDDKIQEPTFSPDGKKVAYGFENNLYIKDLENGEITQMTQDGKKNETINGITDWVYEEEFGFVRAFDWNKDSDKIAFIKFDETDVPEFSMDRFGEDLYQTQDVFKYPKAGEKNSLISLHIYELEDNEVVNVEFKQKYEDFYIPRIRWTNKPNILSAQLINRHQNKLDLWLVDADDYSTELILTETDEAYVDVTDNLTFLDDNSFIWTSEKDGYNHIYHYDEDGEIKNQITKGDWEVTNYYGYDNKSERIFYQSVEKGSINRDVYAIDLKGKNKTLLSTGNGTTNADFSTDFTYFISSFSNAETPTVYTLHDAETGKAIKIIEDNKDLAAKVGDYGILAKEFSTINVNGNDLNMWTIKPANFDESKEYPLFMHQYSGPGSQQVSNRWHGSNDYWFQYLAQQGYYVVSIDGRGTGLKGRDFKKVTQNELGKFEVEDQIQAAKQLGDLPFIDAERIGIWGWSYGGFMSSNALFKGNDVFKMAIAVAPVTSWRFYDTIYTERYMTTPQENASGYDENSPINHVDKLKGNFLLVHGSADDNVHVQNTMRLIEALVQANKDFDWLIYPDKNHGIYGGNTRLHLYNKMTDFLNEHLGDKIVK